MIDTLFDNNMEELSDFYVVSLGSLFYVRGLARIGPTQDHDTASYEFSNNIKVAHLFLLKDFAKEIADLSGGESKNIKLTRTQFKEYCNESELYKNSEGRFYREQMDQLDSELRSYEEKKG